MENTFTVTSEEVGQRLDVWCVSHVQGISRATIQKLIKDGGITVNGRAVKPKYIVQVDDSVLVPAAADMPMPETEVPEIPIIHEDTDIVVINKPPGVSAHPGSGVASPTVSSWFTKRYPQADVGEPGRPGIVHRLDKDTSGVMVLAKTPKAYERLKEQFKRHRVRKEYIALVFGVPGARDGRIVQSIIRSPRNPARRTVSSEGKPAITEWKVERTFGNDYTLVRLFPFTGRTHQIRVHLHHIGYPIVGDALYTYKRQRPPEGVHRQLLHAEKLTFQLMSGKKKTFEAPLAEDFAAVLDKLS